MSQQLNVAIVGCGSITQRGLLPHLAQPDAEGLFNVVAVCDVEAERAAQVAAQYNVPAWYASTKAMLQDASSEIDALLIATPAAFHYEIGMAAVQAGKHIHVQKPLTLSVAEATRLTAAAAAQDVRIVASPVQMLGPGAQRIKEIIAQGGIGRVYWALASTAFMGHEYEPFRADRPVDPTWYYKPGGGPIYDMATYTLHTLTGILGPVRRVAAMSGIGLPARTWQGRTITVEMDDNTLLLLEFGDGRFGVVGGQFAQMGQVVGWGFMGIYGSSGALEITDLFPDTAYPSHVTVNPPSLADTLALSGRPNLEGAPGYISGSHRGMGEAHLWADICYLLDCIRRGEDRLQTTAHARHVIEIIEKGYLAARTGTTQPLVTTF
jgi:predicted dehydrogenase